MSGTGWRIDDLAQRAAVPVDTIRYYSREGLLPPPQRSGRHKLYGPRHLDRLSRIRELQERRFSLAAIRAILDADRPGLDSIFGGTGQYTLAELIERTGVDADLVERLRGVGLLPEPAEFGRESYDEADLSLLQAVVELREIGMTPEVLTELGAIYVRHFRALQADVHAMLAGQRNPEWDPASMIEVQRKLTANAGRLIPAVDRVLNYVHQRTVQRLTLDAIRRAQETGRGVGGIRRDELDA
ncbi:MAG TPA: MerR family transcriptional regulator [Acidimicrobiia bacterium]|nr:MerR family transcriptional regulator [Acidimicrobiia bacterium]